MQSSFCPFLNRSCSHCCVLKSRKPCLPGRTMTGHSRPMGIRADPQCKPGRLLQRRSPLWFGGSRLVVCRKQLRLMVLVFRLDLTEGAFRGELHRRLHSDCWLSLKTADPFRNACFPLHAPPFCSVITVCRVIRLDWWQIYFYIPLEATACRRFPPWLSLQQAVVLLNGLPSSSRRARSARLHGGQASTLRRTQMTRLYSGR